MTRLKRQRRLILDTIMLGVIGALSAQLFTLLLHFFQNLFLGHLAGYVPPGLPDEGGVLKEVIGSHGLWLIPVITTVGGLISGVLVYSLAPEAEGHGTDTAVKAFHHAGGYIRARVPPLKMITSAITIGSGGAAGREGPTALISAGVGSVYATITKRPDEERRLLMLIGMAAGLSAIFRSPIGTAVFAIEVLYSEMESDMGVLLYTMLGSIVAYTINGLFVGFQPLFNVPADLARPDFADYLWYIVLGCVAGLIATLLPVVFYRGRDAFHSLPVPPHLKPAIGGLGLGLMALVLPQVLGGGYGWIQEAIDGRLAAGLLLTLVFAKIVALTLTVSSGGSGGVFAPSLFVGAMLGGFLAQIMHLPPAGFVIVGMAAVFSGAARVPVATLLMVVEMTDGFVLLAPAALAVILSYLIQVRLSRSLKYKSLYEMQVPTRPDSPAHQLEHVMAALRLLHDHRVRLPAGMTHLDLQTLLESGVPIDLPEGKQLNIGVLMEDTPYVGQTLGTVFRKNGHSNGIEIAAVLRDHHTLLPEADIRLQVGDELLVITSPLTWERLNLKFEPLEHSVPEDS
ncbi:MAG: chloride channel protein [Candidatus Promineifilaceae bacterium]